MQAFIEISLYGQNVQKKCKVNVNPNRGWTAQNMNSLDERQTSEQKTKIYSTKEKNK